MLLHQTSGMQDFFQDPHVDAALRDKTRALDHRGGAPELRPRRGVFPPGKGWHYSNTNFVLLGLVAEKAGGASWADSSVASCSTRSA